MQLIFEWDAKKATINLKKHGVSFEEAKTLFNDPFLLTYPDTEHSDIEERFISIGYSTRNRTLLVVHADREEGEEFVIIRIISCRQVTATERRLYEENYG
jgi:uncharacterized protein